MSEIKIHSSWKSLLSQEFSQPYFEKLIGFVKNEYQAGTIYPPGGLIFNAFELCPFDELKVVILGQDPYHGAGQAHGLSFSVKEGVKPPPSLVNIYKEINSDLDIPIPPGGNLERWATQGVLLLNATLTVKANNPGSHQGQGWEEFTDAVIKVISDKKEHIVFLLWGKFAQSKEVLIDTSKHLVLKAAHPSPYSANSGFFGSKHFSKTNQYLEQHGLNPINW